MTDPEITWSPPKAEYILVHHGGIVHTFESYGLKFAKSVQESIEKERAIKTELYIKTK